MPINSLAPERPPETIASYAATRCTEQIDPQSIKGQQPMQRLLTIVCSLVPLTVSLRSSELTDVVLRSPQQAVVSAQIVPLESTAGQILECKTEVRDVVRLSQRISDGIVLRDTSKLEALSKGEKEATVTLMLGDVYVGESSAWAGSVRVRVDNPESLVADATGTVIYEWTMDLMEFNVAMPGAEATYLSVHTNYLDGELIECGCFVQTHYHKTDALYELVEAADGLLTGASYRWVRGKAHWKPFLVRVETSNRNPVWKDYFGETEGISSKRDSSGDEAEVAAALVRQTKQLLGCQQDLVRSLTD